MKENESKSREELLLELAKKDRLYREKSQLLYKKSHRLDNLHFLLDDMMAGVGMAEIIPGPDGEAYDFCILEINETLGRLLNIAPNNIRGSTILQLLPNADKSWLKIFSDVVIHRKPARFEKYSPFFRKWFKVQASSPDPGVLYFLFIDITSVKQAEQELSRHRLLLEQADLLSLSGAWEWIQETDQHSFSPGWLSIHGCKKTPQTFEELMSLVHPDDQAAVINNLENARTNFKKNYSIEHRIIRQDNGEVRYIHVLGQLNRGPSGEIDRIYGETRDITEQKLSQQAIQRQNILISGINSIFAAVVNSADDKEFGTICLSVVERITGSPLSLLAETGSDGYLRDIAASNPTWGKCSLINQQDPKNKPRLPHLDGIYASVFKEGIGLLTNDPALHPDSKGVPPGHPELKSFMAAPLTLDGNTTGMISVANRKGGYKDEDLDSLNTLARVISESLSRRRTQKELLDQEIRYRNLFMSSPDAIFVNLEGKISLVNDACIRMFGARTAEDLIGKSPYTLYHPDDHPLIGERIRRIWEHHESLPSYEARIVRLDGRQVDVEANSAGFFFGQSRAIHVILRDISERKQVEKDLERSNKELEEFAYTISHDLQEPIRSIIGFLQLYNAKTQTVNVDDKALMYLDRVIAASHRMKGLIDNLLSLSRVSTKGVKIAPTELNHLVGSVLEDLHSTLEERNARIIHHDLPVLAVDANLARRLFQNILTNAIKYNTSHAPVVKIGCRPSDEGYEFFVKDNGIGIEQKFHERIFKPFQRLHTDQEYEGMGMGLTLCRKIVERHNGRIWVDSQPGKGSTIYFTLSSHLGGYDFSSGSAHL